MNNGLIAETEAVWGQTQASTSCRQLPTRNTSSSSDCRSLIEVDSLSATSRDLCRHRRDILSRHYRGRAEPEQSPTIAVQQYLGSARARGRPLFITAIIVTGVVTPHLPQDVTYATGSLGPGIACGSVALIGPSRNNSRIHTMPLPAGVCIAIAALPSPSPVTVVAGQPGLCSRRLTASSSPSNKRLSR